MLMFKFIACKGKKKNPQLQANCGFFSNLFLRNIFKGFLEQLPEGLYGSDEGALSRSVRRFHRRTKADHIEVRILTQNDGALQTSVIYLDDTISIEEFLVLFQQQVQDGRLGVGVPATIRTGSLYLHTSHVETSLDCLHDIILHVLTATSGEYFQR